MIWGIDDVIWGIDGAICGIDDVIYRIDDVIYVATLLNPSHPFSFEGICQVQYSFMNENDVSNEYTSTYAFSLTHVLGLGFYLDPKRKLI